MAKLGRKEREDKVAAVVAQGGEGSVDKSKNKIVLLIDLKETHRETDGEN